MSFSETTDGQQSSY